MQTPPCRVPSWYSTWRRLIVRMYAGNGRYMPDFAVVASHCKRVVDHISRVNQSRSLKRQAMHADARQTTCGASMSTNQDQQCAALSTLERIAAARWTPYVAETLRQWSREALSNPGACPSSRAPDCPACIVLREIGALGWETNLARRIQDKARETLKHLGQRVPLAHPTLRALG